MRDLMKLPVTVPHLCYSYNMAARKPKGFDWNDNLADFKKGVSRAVANNPIISQNIKYFQASQRGVKAVATTAAKDAASAVAGAAAGKAVSAIGSVVANKVGSKVASSVANTALGKLTTGLDKASSGGKVYKTNTPFGPTLASTKIMSAPQREAAIGGLTKAASNRAAEIGKSVGADAKSAVSNITGKASKTVAAATTAAASKKNSKGSQAKKR